MLCAVCGCKNYNGNSSNKQKSVRYYSFPKDPVLLKKWVDFCRRKESFNTNTSRICSDHFTENDTERNLQFEMGFMKKNLLKLKPGSFPSVYIGKTTVTKISPNKVSMKTNHGEKDIPRPNDEYLEKIKELQQENFRLKLNEQKLHKTIKALDIKLSKSNWENSNMESKLKTVFTNAQIKKLKTGKQMRWSEDDVAKSITLYSASTRAYKLLKKEKFPLPSIRTLQRWTQKSDSKKSKILYDSDMHKPESEEDAKEESVKNLEENSELSMEEEDTIEQQTSLRMNSKSFDYGDHSYFILEKNTII